MTHLAAALLSASRPKTLSAALAPVTVGTAVAAFVGYSIRWWIGLLALLAAVAIQIGTNLFNDLLDFEKGADTHQRLGPARVTQTGTLTPQQVRAAALGSFGVAVALGVPLVAVGGWPIAMIGVLSLAFGYAYTGGPYPLAYNGLGELFVLTFFGLVAVAGTYFLYAHQVHAVALVAGVQIGLLACALLAVNNLRDVATDRQANKRTLAVRFGVPFGRAEILACCLAPFALNVHWVGRGSLAAALLPVLSLPLAVAAVRQVYRHEPSVHYNRILAMVGALLLLFSVLLATGLLL